MRILAETGTSVRKRFPALTVGLLCAGMARSCPVRGWCSFRPARDCTARVPYRIRKTRARRQRVTCLAASRAAHARGVRWGEVRGRSPLPDQRGGVPRPGCLRAAAEAQAGPVWCRAGPQGYRGSPATAPPRRNWLVKLRAGRASLAAGHASGETTPSPRAPPGPPSQGCPR
jgi:hypothetical protein